jgi:hypothetical protein
LRCGSFVGEREQLFDRRLQNPRQANRDNRVGHVAAGFDRIDRLAAHAHCFRQVACREPALLTKDAQIAIS